MTFDHTGKYYSGKCINCGAETYFGAYCQKCRKIMKLANEHKTLDKFFNKKTKH